MKLFKKFIFKIIALVAVLGFAILVAWTGEIDQNLQTLVIFFGLIIIVPAFMIGVEIADPIEKTNEYDEF